MSDGVMTGVKVVFFDVDDTLYAPSSGLSAHITSRIEAFLVEKMGVAAEDAASARANYQKHGTTLAGLVHEKPSDFPVGEYIDFVYGGVKYEEFLKPDAKMDAMLQALSKKRRVFAFSNAHKEHVLAVIAARGISLAAFEGFVEARGMGFKGLKPDTAAFTNALRVCGDCEPREALLFDDNFANVEAARDFGMQAVHISNSEDAYCTSEGCNDYQSRTASPRNSKVAQSCMCTPLDLPVAYPDLLE